MTNQLFDPPGVPWTRVQSKLATKRRIMACVGMAVLLLVLAGVMVFVGPTWWLWLIGAALVALLLFRLWLIGRAVRNLGYCEREEDLWITSGALFRRLTVVPYGRMQLVDVDSGPIDRLFNLANVQLHTASSGTDAHIPGLLPDDAAVLRDRLTELGISEMSGL